MYTTIKRYSKQLQRRLSSLRKDIGSIVNGSDNGNTSTASSSLKKPLLPETISDASEVIVNSIPTHAYLTLATAVIALSSVGPSLDLQHGVAPILKIYWRMTGTWMVLCPVALASFYRDGGFPKLSKQQALTFVSASFCYAVMCIGFVLSLEYTSVGNAVIFSNTHALLLLLGRFLVGSHVSLLESGGALTAFVGGVFCTYDEAETAAEEEALLLSSTSTTTSTPSHSGVLDGSDVTNPIWVGCLGDLIAVISALGGTLYLVLASSVRARFPSVYVFVFMNMVTASMITLTFILLTGEEVSLSRDIRIGLLGFLNSRYDRLPLEMFMVVVCNLTGSMGYLKSTIYFDNLVISVATLMEPVVASAMAYIMGVGVLPGFLGLVGNVLVAMGTVMVINPRGSKKESCMH